MNSIESDAAEIAMGLTELPLDKLIMRRKHWTQVPADSEHETQYVHGSLGYNQNLVYLRERLIEGLFRLKHERHRIAAFIGCDEAAVRRVCARVYYEVANEERAEGRRLIRAGKRSAKRSESA